MKRTFEVIPASSGISIGRVLFCREVEPSGWSAGAKSTKMEWRRYRNACEEFRERTRRKADRMDTGFTGDDNRGGILRSQAAMADDPVLREKVREGILSGQNAETALDYASGQFIKALSAAEDEWVRLRAADVQNMRDAVLRILMDLPEIDFSRLEPGTVLVAEALSPSAISELDPQKVSGVILCSAGVTSHTGILLRSLEIPAVMGAQAVYYAAKNEDLIVFDGGKGIVLLNPVTEEIAQYKKEQEAFYRRRESQRRLIGRETVTADGEKVWLGANVGNENDVLRAQVVGCDGVGLFRSEFLYQGRETPPSEEEQFQIYCRMALALKGRPLVIRTLDVGGDKKLPWLPFEKEENPFLGCRGIRLCFKEEDLFLAQLRAILRAKAFGDVRLLVPFVTGVGEVRHVKELLERAKEQLLLSGKRFAAELPLGVMIETPAAVWSASLLAQHVDFFSVGTNDLTQYTMAADRGSILVSHLSSPYDPAVLRALRYAVFSAQRAEIPIEICGEAASDAAFLPFLLALGFSRFSVVPAAILTVRETLSQWTARAANALLEKAMTMETEQEIRLLAQKHLCLR